MRRQLNAWIIIGTIMLFVWGADGLTLLLECGQDNRWWTPRTKPLSLEQSRDDVEIFIAGESLASRLDKGTLLLADAGRQVPLTAADVGIRVNNKYRVRASRVLSAAICAAGVTAGALLLVFGIIWLRRGRQTAAVRPGDAAEERRP